MIITIAGGTLLGKTEISRLLGLTKSQWERWHVLFCLPAGRAI
jgi:hypothetical protein